MDGRAASIYVSKLYNNKVAAQVWHPTLEFYIWCLIFCMYILLLKNVLKTQRIKRAIEIWGDILRLKKEVCTRTILETITVTSNYDIFLITSLQWHFTCVNVFIGFITFIKGAKKKRI